MRRRFLTGKVIEGKNMPDISWHGFEIHKPLWNDPDASLLAFTLAGIEYGEADLHIIMNMSEENVTLELPVIEGKDWCLALDTSLKSPEDIISPLDQRPLEKRFYSVNPKTVTVLENISI